MKMGERVKNSDCIGSAGALPYAFFVVGLFIFRYLGLIGTDIDRRLIIEMVIAQFYSELALTETHLYRAGPSFRYKAFTLPLLFEHLWLHFFLDRRFDSHSSKPTTFT